jgi:hypothetical protein
MTTGNTVYGNLEGTTNRGDSASSLSLNLSNFFLSPRSLWPRRGRPFLSDFWFTVVALVLFSFLPGADDSMTLRGA